MQVERCRTVNKDQGTKEKCQAVVANASKSRGQERSRIKDEKLHGESGQPENRDHGADRPGEGSGRGQFVRSKKRQRSERHNNQNNKAAVNPKEPAQKRMKCGEIRAPGEQVWRQ